MEDEQFNSERHSQECSNLRVETGYEHHADYDFDCAHVPRREESGEYPRPHISLHFVSMSYVKKSQIDANASHKEPQEEIG